MRRNADDETEYLLAISLNSAQQQILPRPLYVLRRGGGGDERTRRREKTFKNVCLPPMCLCVCLGMCEVSVCANVASLFKFDALQCWTCVFLCRLRRRLCLRSYVNCLPMCRFFIFFSCSQEGYDDVIIFFRKFSYRIVCVRCEKVCWIKFICIYFVRLMWFGFQISRIFEATVFSTWIEQL